MKILITGAKGMLGSDLTALFSKEHDVVAVDADELDITLIDSVISFVRGVMPQIIINAAAATNVDGCETETDTAYSVNATGPRNLAVASNEMQIPLVHYSTDYVFDGLTDKPYTEFDKTNPIGIYGKSKLAGEEYIKTLTNRYYIIRTQWLYGRNGGNFVSTILKRAKETGVLKVVDDQSGCPTYTKDLCAATNEIIQTGAYGLYHAVNSGIVTWYCFTKEIIRQSGLKGISLTPCSTAEFPRPAKRPAYSPLACYCMSLAGLALPRPYEEALQDYINE